MLPVLICWPLAVSGQGTPGAEKLEPVKTSITVSEKITAETPASISTLGALQIEQAPGVNLDDRLRMVPGFTLFRRNSSIAANPTTQGISLRGLGSSAASRSLVLWDGVPMNDPFGGWVYWTRFPPDQIQEVDVARGAATSVFGDRAMSGAITILSREFERIHFNASYEGGNLNTHELTAGAGSVWRNFAASTQVRAFTTDGYYIVPARLRGRADTKAGVSFVAGNTRLDWFRGSQRFSTKIDILAEDRENGTILQRNSTSLGTISGNYGWQKDNNSISVLGFHTREEFRASFSAVTSNRNVDTLSYNQQVPAEGTGAAAFWEHRNSRFSTIAGADVERDEGYSTDRLAPTGIRFGGGVRLQRGVFGQANVKTGIAQWFVGVREHFTGGGDTFLSPSGGLVVGRGRWRARASGYRSFRAPTLNELFREFRVGNVVTLPNGALRPETARGAELGFDLIDESRRLSVTLFHNDLENLITNVTVTGGATITRQRRNAIAATARGVEADFHQAWRNLRGDFSFLYVDSTYMTRLRVPQVPRNQGTAQLSYVRGGTLASFGVRTYALQFEDDLNSFILPGYATVQLTVRQRLRKGVSAMMSFENLLDREFLVAASPTPNVGAPRLVRAGLRWEFR